MPAKQANGGRTLSEIAAKLPASVFVMRGHIREAFGLSRKEMDSLVRSGVFAAKYIVGKKKRARFERTQVLAAARTELGVQ